MLNSEKKEGSARPAEKVGGEGSFDVFLVFRGLLWLLGGGGLGFGLFNGAFLFWVWFAPLGFFFTTLLFPWVYPLERMCQWGGWEWLSLMVYGAYGLIFFGLSRLLGKRKAFIMVLFVHLFLGGFYFLSSFAFRLWS